MCNIAVFGLVLKKANPLSLVFFFWMPWIIPTIQTTDLPCCCHLSRFSWHSTSGTINCRGTLSRAFSATCLHTPPTFRRSCPAIHIYITQVVLSGVEVRCFGKQPKHFQGLCSRAIFFLCAICCFFLLEENGVIIYLLIFNCTLLCTLSNLCWLSKEHGDTVQQYLLGRLLGWAVREATEKTPSVKLLVVICCCLSLQGITWNNYKMHESKKFAGKSIHSHLRGGWRKMGWVKALWSSIMTTLKSPHDNHPPVEKSSSAPVVHSSVCLFKDFMISFIFLMFTCYSYLKRSLHYKIGTYNTLLPFRDHPNWKKTCTSPQKIHPWVNCYTSKTDSQSWATIRNPSLRKQHLCNRERNMYMWFLLTGKSLFKGTKIQTTDTVSLPIAHSLPIVSPICIC